MNSGNGDNSSLREKLLFLSIFYEYVSVPKTIKGTS